MTERERWIVYPLLFLALGAALRDKLSEHVQTKTIECQELVINSEESAGRPSTPLVQIGSIKRTSADSPHLGQILVDGLIQGQIVNAKGLQAEAVQAENVNADNYFFRRLPFAPVLRAIPGVSPADQLRAIQQQQAAEAAAAAAAQKDANSTGTPVAGDKSAPNPADKPAEAQPPAK